MTVRILMAGDSLTAGYVAIAEPNGPRQRVYDVLTAAGLNFTLVGSTHPPGSTVTENNCAAVAGYRTDEVFNLLEVDLPGQTPDIICSLSGANDVAYGPLPNLGFWAGMIDKNVGACFRLRPTAAVILGTCTVMAAPNEVRRLELNTFLPVYAAAHERCGRRILVSDTANAYTAVSLVDNVHPNLAGFDALGDVLAASILEAVDRWGYT